MPDGILRYTSSAKSELLLFRVLDYLGMIAIGKPKYWWDGKQIIWYDD